MGDLRRCFYYSSAMDTASFEKQKSMMCDCVAQTSAPVSAECAAWDKTFEAWGSCQNHTHPPLPSGSTYCVCSCGIVLPAKFSTVHLRLCQAPPVCPYRLNNHPRSIQLHSASCNVWQQVASLIQTVFRNVTQPTGKILGRATAALAITHTKMQNVRRCVLHRTIPMHKT